MMKILCTSDLHGHWNFDRWPEADVLVIAGDSTMYGRKPEYQKFARVLETVQYPEVILVAGNHDWAFQDDPTVQQYFQAPNIHYLQDTAALVQGVRFSGHPWTPQFYNWAFMKPRGTLHTIWDHIPLDTDVLVTHGPPAGKCDFNGREYCGCTELRDAVDRVKPKVHIFGHIHYSHGTAFNEHTIFVNASRCTEGYDPINPPILVEI